MSKRPKSEAEQRAYKRGFRQAATMIELAARLRDHHQFADDIRKFTRSKWVRTAFKA